MNALNTKMNSFQYLLSLSESSSEEDADSDSDVLSNAKWDSNREAFTRGPSTGKPSSSPDSKKGKFVLEQKVEKENPVRQTGVPSRPFESESGSAVLIFMLKSSWIRADL